MIASIEADISNDKQGTSRATYLLVRYVKEKTRETDAGLIGKTVSRAKHRANGTVSFKDASISTQSSYLIVRMPEADDNGEVYERNIQYQTPRFKVKKHKDGSITVCEEMQDDNGKPTGRFSKQASARITVKLRDEPNKADIKAAGNDGKANASSNENSISATHATSADVDGEASEPALTYSTVNGATRLTVSKSCSKTVTILSDVPLEASTDSNGDITVTIEPVNDNEERQSAPRGNGDSASAPLHPSLLLRHDDNATTCLPDAIIPITVLATGACLLTLTLVHVAALLTRK